MVDERCTDCGSRTCTGGLGCSATSARRSRRRLVVATDMQGIRHLAQLHVTMTKNGSYASVLVSTACIPATTQAEAIVIAARPRDLPMIQHKGLTLVSYQRVALSTPPATCMTCIRWADTIPNP
jgi:hypothetical protein